MDHPLKDKFDIGVIVGRFQVPSLSKGHKHVIDNVFASHKQVIIVIGVSPTLGTKQNSLGYTARMQMIQKEYPKAIITHILDINSNNQWSRNLDLLLRSLCPIGTICLYGGRDSFLESYNGRYDTFELGVADKTEGTKIREEVGKEVIDSHDFRAGVIFACQNQYPKVFPTVDIAVLKRDKKEIRVLLGKRPNKDHFRFPGGFVDPKDKNLEESAIRELLEEIDVGIDNDSIKYLGSNCQEDWRYNSNDEKIHTVLFEVDYTFGPAKSISEEFIETDWILLSPWSLPKIEDAHKDLFQILLDKYIKKCKIKDKKPFIKNVV